MRRFLLFLAIQLALFLAIGFVSWDIFWVAGLAEIGSGPRFIVFCAWLSLSVVVATGVWES